MKEIESREDVKTLVDSFYKQVLKDEIIGYIFTDVAKIKLDTHMPIMYDFWESVLFGKAVYKGNPMNKHFDLNRKSALLPKHFDRWKKLWISTIDSLFIGERANEAKIRANTIAYLMQSKMESQNS